MELRKLYETAHDHWRTEERLDMLRSFSPSADTKQRDVWERFVGQHPLWREVPDPSYLAYRWWKRFVKPEIHRRHLMIDSVPVSGPTSLSKAKKQCKLYAIGQWKQGDEYQGMMGGSLLADRFVEG